MGSLTRGPGAPESPELPRTSEELGGEDATARGPALDAATARGLPVAGGLQPEDIHRLLLEERAQLLAEKDELQREADCARQRQEHFAKQALELAERVSHKKRVIKALASEVDVLKGQLRQLECTQRRQSETAAQVAKRVITHALRGLLRGAFARWAAFVAVAREELKVGAVPAEQDTNAKIARLERELAVLKAIAPAATSPQKCRTLQPSPVFQRGPTREQGQLSARRAAAPGRRLCSRAEPSDRRAGNGRPEGEGAAPQGRGGPAESDIPVVQLELAEEPRPETVGHEAAEPKSRGARSWLSGRDGDEPPTPTWLFGGTVLGTPQGAAPHVQELLSQRVTARAVSVETPGNILVWNDDPGQPHLLIVPKEGSQLSSRATTPRAL